MFDRPAFPLIHILVDKLDTTLMPLDERLPYVVFQVVTLFLEWTGIHACVSPPALGWPCTPSPQPFTEGIWEWS
jgi:hypothetical protein